MSEKAEIISDEELGWLLEDLHRQYGYDFSGYAKASLRRRISRIIALHKLPNFTALQYRLKSDPEYFAQFLAEVTVHVTEMFRDPSFYKTLAKEVIPVLSTYPLIRIWHAGCSTGEEVYSMAILLQEAGVLHKSLLYATDINANVLERAGKGIFPLSQMRLHSENYILAGGKKDFSSYYTASYDHAKFDARLSERMIFSTHNLVSDSSFNQFQLICCRNVLIYFEKELQDQALKLFDDSLEPLGFLALGAKETLKFSPIGKHFTQVYPPERVWRKVV